MLRQPRPRRFRTGYDPLWSAAVPSSSKSRSSSARSAVKVYDHIFDRIAGGGYAKGEQLPTEFELAKSFVVSRTVVREALVRLRDEGLIQSRRGAGSFVTATPDQAIRRFAPVASIGDIQRCYEFRIHMETAACTLAAIRCDKDELAELHAKLRATEDIDDVAAGVDADLDFHIAVTKASHNRFFVDALVSLRSGLTVGMELVRRLSLSRPDDALGLMYEEHQAVYDAIASGDPDRAGAAMRHHLEAARKRFFEES
jgi:GntR family transcriptional regulator, transcriptional repressor for pyruvate dehydrogenase complex